MLKFKLDSRKAVEAAAILAKHSRTRKISSKRLLALLYIASRECLKRSGRPMLGGRLVAMPHGPVHADIYSLIKNERGSEGLAEWSEHFHTDGYKVVLDKDPGQNALSRFEIRLLNEVIEKYEDEDVWDLAHSTHRFPEYAAARVGRHRGITLEQLIYALRGLSPIATAIVRDLKEKDEIDEVFAILPGRLRASGAGEG